MVRVNLKNKMVLNFVDHLVLFLILVETSDARGKYIFDSFYFVILFRINSIREIF